MEDASALVSFMSSSCDKQGSSNSELSPAASHSIKGNMQKKGQWSLMKRAAQLQHMEWGFSLAYWLLTTWGLAAKEGLIFVPSLLF